MKTAVPAALLALVLAGASPVVQADDVCLSGLADSSLQYWPSGGQASQAITLRVQRQGPSGGPSGYSVRAELLGQGSFRLTSSSGATLPFRLYFSDRANVSNPSQARELQSAQTAGGFADAELDPALGGGGCPSGSGNASLIVVYAQNDLQSTLAGNYSGTVQLTIAAE